MPSSHVIFSCHLLVSSSRVIFSCHIFVSSSRVKFSCHIFASYFRVIFSCHIFVSYFRVIFSCHLFTLFIGICPLLPYTTLVNFWFQATGPSFFFYIGIWYLGWENLIPLEIEEFWYFSLKIQFFTAKGEILPNFWQFFNITLVILEICMARDLSC